MLLEIKDGFGHTQNAWVCGVRDHEYLITAHEGCLRLIDAALKDLYSPERAIKWMDPQARETAWIRKWLVDAGIGSSYHPWSTMYLVGSRRILQAQVTRGASATADPAALADMVIEHLMDRDILVASRLKGWGALISLDCGAFDSWVAAGYLALEPDHG